MKISHKTLGIFLIVLSSNLFSADTYIVTDEGSKLQWEDSDRNNLSIWKIADSFCRQLTLGQHDDWRLPTKSELVTLSKNKELKKRFKHLVTDVYWSDSEDPQEEDNFLTIYLGNAFVSSTFTCEKTSTICVRTLTE